ncbi:MAG: phosphotyrosine protein phosphatase, partial [Thermoplasmatota archaeon]
SAGTNTYAETPLSNQLLEWADTIFVMEPHHKQSILKTFDSTIPEKQIIVLDIPDRYQYMDPTLIDMLKKRVSPYL